jgi:hypothetical protein
VDDQTQLLRGIAWSIGLNTVIPVLLYQFSKWWISPSELTALLFATAFPVAESVFGLLRERRVDPIAILVMLGIAVDAAAIGLGGSAQILLLRESLFTGAFGAACFVSLLLPRPLMFYFGRHFMSAGDAAKRARFDRSWALPEVRRANRWVTTMWGVVFTGELGIRVALIYSLTAAWVLVVSPLILGALTVATLIWSLAYSRRMRMRVLPRLLEQELAASRTAS